MNSLDSQRQDSLKRRWQDQRRTISAVDHPDHHHNRSTLPSSFYTRSLVGATPSSSPSFMCNYMTNNNPKDLKTSFLAGGYFDDDDDDDDLVSTVVPPVTVVLEGRSICQRISLHKHASYQSLAVALRQMFVDDDLATNNSEDIDDELDLSNAVPGHLIAYEDMENDLLLVGDLNWKDFVRVAKRIRILPEKAKSRKGSGGV